MSDQTTFVQLNTSQVSVEVGTSRVIVEMNTPQVFVETGIHFAQNLAGKLILGTMAAPVLEGPATGSASEQVGVTISNYHPQTTYELHVTNSEASQDGALITWTLPNEVQEAVQVLIVVASRAGYKETHSGFLLMMEGSA